MPENHAVGSTASNNLRVFSNASWNRAASNSLNSSPFPLSATVSAVPLHPSFRQERRPSCLDRGMCTAECRHANATKKLLTRVVVGCQYRAEGLSISYVPVAPFLRLPTTLSLSLSLVRSFTLSFVSFFFSRRLFLSFRSFVPPYSLRTPRETSTTSRTTIVPIDQAAGSLW